MMNKHKKIKKIFSITLLTLTILNSNPIYVVAADAFFEVTANGDASNAGSATGHGGIRQQVEEIFAGGTRKTRCSWNKTLSSSSAVYVDAYGVDNIKDIQKEFLAGTYIALNVHEEKMYFEKATDIKIESFEKVYECENKYEIPIPCSSPTSKKSEEKNIIATPLALDNYQKNNNIIQLKVFYELGEWKKDESPPNNPKPPAEQCTKTVREYKWQSTCPNGWTYTGNETFESSDTITDEEKAWCDKYQKVSRSSLSHSYDVKYRDSNDINESRVSSIEVTGGCPVSNIGPDINHQECTFTYSPENACINVKTGKVIYTSKACNSSNDEYTISKIVEGNTTYWKYFIPLNAKSGDEGFSFTMGPNLSSIQSVPICQNIIDRYSDYQNLIKPARNFAFGGDEERDKRIIATAGGCLYQSTIKIPIVQKFYNEVNKNGGLTFQGFNFYYKPIDITNPFPNRNSLTDTSLWYEWNRNTNKNPDLEKSYDTITYIADSINAETIREYNDTNPYTSWANMNKDGTSKFISNGANGNMIIQRNGNLNNNEKSVYPLGCGPLNTNVTNDMKQTECDIG